MFDKDHLNAPLVLAYCLISGGGAGSPSFATSCRRIQSLNWETVNHKLYSSHCLLSLSGSLVLAAVPSTLCLPVFLWGVTIFSYFFQFNNKHIFSIIPTSFWHCTVCNCRNTWVMVASRRRANRAFNMLHRRVLAASVDYSGHTVLQ